MKKISKQVASLLLAVIMVLPLGLFSTNPFVTKAQAASEKSANRELHNNVEYNATNALGEIIEQAIEEDTEENNGYFIQNVTVDGLIATASISAPDEATLVVAVYDEKSNAMVTSGKIEVNSSTEQVEVSLEECVMPEYFVVKAFLLGVDKAPVCKNYEGKEYTEKYQEFLSKTVYDFDENEVINIDYSYDNNFAVVTDEAINAEQYNNKNVLRTIDYENGIYVLDYADETIKSLKDGDVFYFEYGSELDEYILTKVKMVEIEGDTVTITASDEFEISDFFSYIKIDTSKPYNEPVLNTAALSDPINFDETVEHSISVEKEYEGDGNVKAKFSGELKLSFNIKFYYDAKLFKDDYYEMENTTTASFEGTTEIKVEAKKELEPIVFFNGGIPIYPGLEAEVEVLLKITFSAAVSASGGIEFKIVNGTKKVSGEKEQDISKNPSVVFKFAVEGNAKFTVTPSVSVGIKILKIVKISLTVGCEFEISATAKIIDAEGGLNPSNGKKHACGLCVDGDVYLSVMCYFEVTAAVTKKKQKSLLKLNLLTVKRKLGDFYISFISLSDGSISFWRFGFGECPNYEDAPKPHSHVLSSWITTSKATCTKTGERIKKCTTCGAVVKKETLSKVAHSTGSWITTAQPTCVKAGTKVKCCSVCKVVVSKESIAKTAHDESSWDITKEATCVENGTKVKWCDSCGSKVKTETLYATGHTADEWKIVKEASCTEAGLKEQRCETCGVKLNEVIIPAGCYIKHWLFETDTETGELIGNATCAQCGRFLETKNGLLKLALSADEKSYILKGCASDLTGEIEIPAEFNNKPVVKIGEKAFYCSGGLTGIVIPDSVTYIDYYAFWGCSNLGNIQMGNGVTTIGNRAFYDCDALVSVSIPESVIKIEPYAFLKCDALIEIIVDENNGMYSNDNVGVLFNKDKTKLIQYPMANPAKCYIVPDSVTYVGYNAFYSCDNLEEVVFADNLISIDDDAFYDCDNLESITLPYSITEVGSRAFYDCINLENVYYSGSQTQWDLINFDSYNQDLLCATIHYNYSSQLITASYIPQIMSTNSTPVDEKYNASLNNAVAGNEYLILVLKHLANEVDLSNNNLCYIDQKTATEESLLFEFIPKSNDFEIVVIIGDFGEGNEMRFANEWKPVHTILWIVDGEETETTIMYGEAITVPVPEKEGYTFTGWDKEIPSTMPAEDLNFTATWSKNSYKLIWLIDGVETETTMGYGEMITAPSDPVKEGYSFVGWDKDIPDTMPAENLTFTAVWSMNSYKVTWMVDGKGTETIVAYGESINAPTPEKEGYTFIGWDKEVLSTMPADDLTFTAMWNVNNYKVTWIIDGEETEAAVTYGETITAPVPVKECYNFIGWDKSIPATMPANDLTFTAVFECSLYMNVRIPSSNIIKYGDSIKLHADVDLPSGHYIEWSVDNGNFDYSVSADSKICIITPSKSGSTTFTATVCDAEGNKISSDTQVMTSKAGFFDKLIAFFREIFGLLKDYEQAINVTF